MSSKRARTRDSTDLLMQKMFSEYIIRESASRPFDGVTSYRKQYMLTVLEKDADLAEKLRLASIPKDCEYTEKATLWRSYQLEADELLQKKNF